MGAGGRMSFLEFFFVKYNAELQNLCNLNLVHFRSKIHILNRHQVMKNGTEFTIRAVQPPGFTAPGL